MEAGLTFDTGALIAIDRGTRDAALLLKRGRQIGLPMSVPAGVVAEAWRDGRLQARLARFLASSDVEVVPLDETAAQAAGQLCGVSSTSDVIDASVVLCAAARGDVIVTSDPSDLSRLDPHLELYVL